MPLNKRSASWDCEFPVSGSLQAGDERWASGVGSIYSCDACWYRPNGLTGVLLLGYQDESSRSSNGSPSTGGRPSGPQKITVEFCRMKFSNT